MMKPFISAEEAKENVRRHSLDVLHTPLGLYADLEENYKDLFEEVNWAVRRESLIGHSTIIICISTPKSVKEAVNIYKMADFLEGQGFTVIINGSTKDKQVEFVVEW